MGRRHTRRRRLFSEESLPVCFGPCFSDLGLFVGRWAEAIIAVDPTRHGLSDC